MKVLVISNCATKAYIQGMQLLFPDWDVRGVRDAGAAEWVEVGKQEFLDFAGSADIYVGTHLTSLATNYPSLERLPLRDGITSIFIPKFVFRGLHPDVFYLRTKVAPVLPPDTIYSRIVVTSFLLGRSTKEAVHAFNADTYRRIGYFDAFGEEVEGIKAGFKKFGIDLQEEFQSWLKSGRFVYTLNHASALVYFDILLAAVSGRLLPAEERDSRRVLRYQMDNYMERGPIWPVYPELGEPHGIADQLIWRTKKNANYLEMDARTFVKRSYFNLRDAGVTPEQVPGFEAASAALA